MDLAAGAAFGVLAMLGWGVSDFLGKLAVNRVGGYNSLIFGQATGGALALLAMLWLGEKVIPPADAIGITLVVTALWVVGYLAYYAGMEKGLLSVVAPVASSWGAASAVIAALILGEAMTGWQWLSVGVIAAGVILVSTSLKGFPPKRMSGVGWAAIALLAFAAMAVLSKQMVLTLGVFATAFLPRAIGLPSLVVAAPSLKQKVSIPKRGLWPLMSAIGAIEIGAVIAFNVALQQGLVGVTGPIAAAFPAVTVTLAWLVLKEKLEASQKLGVLVALAGMVALALA